MKTRDYLKSVLSSLEYDYNQMEQRSLFHQNEYNKAKSYYDQCAQSPDFLNHPEVIKRNNIQAMFGSRFASSDEEARSKLINQGFSLDFPGSIVNRAKAHLDECYSKYIYPGNVAKNELQPFLSSIQSKEAEINKILANVKNIEPIVQKLTSLSKEVEDIKRENNELRLKTESNNQTIKKLSDETNEFKLDKFISSFNEDQRAHVVHKIGPLKEGIDKNSVTLCVNLSMQKYNPHYVNNNGQSLVELTIEQNDLTGFKTLISQKLDFNHCYGKNTILDLVVKSGNKEFIDTMLDKEPKIFLGKPVLKIKNDFSKAVILSVLKDDVDYVSKLLDIVPDWQSIQYHGDNLLQFAITSGKYEIAEAVLKKDESIFYAVNDNGFNALDVAIIHQKAQGIKLLEQYGTNLKDLLPSYIEQNKVEQMTKILAGCSKEYAEFIIKGLMVMDATNFLANIAEQDHGLLSFADAQNNNLLHLSCNYGHHALAQKLLSYDLSLLNKQNHLGETPLHIAIKNKNIEEAQQEQLLSVLLSHKPDIYIKDSSEFSSYDLVQENGLILAQFFEYEAIGRVEDGFLDQ